MVNPDATYCVILITAGTEENAGQIARTLVEERLAACCSILPKIRSIYRWNDSITEDEELLLVCKSQRALFPQLERRVRDLHTYDVPEIIMLPVNDGSAPYLAWIDESLTGNA
jgi:periplasmic divalent cation tolerance protein